MKTPICSICLGSDILCKACKSKLDSGVISNSDVNISRIIYNLSKNMSILEKVSIEKIIEVDNFVIIICGKGDTANLVGKGGLIVKKLSKITNKRIKVIEKTDSIKEFIQMLLYPVRVTGINVVYTPKGDIYKIVTREGKVIIRAQSVEEIIKAVFGKEIIVSYEKDSGY